MKTLTHSLLILGIGAILQSCAMIKIPKLVKQGEVKSTDYLKETAFNYSNDLIFVEVTINEKNYNFIFDTGAEMSVIGKHITDEIDYKVITTSKVNATTASQEKMEFIAVPKITVGSVDFENTGAIIADIAHFDEVFGCNSVDGIIGNNLMRKASWQIDYKNQKITVSDKVEKLTISENATAITMDAGEIKNVHFDVVVDGVPGKFIFDSGYNGKIQADSNFFNLLKEKNESLLFCSEVGNAVTDLNGVITGTTNIALVKKIDIEGIVLEDQFMSLSGNSSLLVGNEVFENYTLTIDWKNDKLFFEPTKEIKADTMNGYELILVPNFITNRIEISRFRLDHPLQETISIDAEIVKIDGVDVSQFTTDQLCDFWEREGERIRQAQKLEVLVLEGGIKKQIHLTRKELLPK